MVRRSIAHSKQVLKVGMDMADSHCHDHNGSYSLLHSSNKEIIHIQMDRISNPSLFDFTRRTFFLKSLVQARII